MKSSTRRAALSCALLATSAFCGLAAQPAAAQSSGAPAYRSLDANGVDLTHGGFHLNFLEGSIGSGEAELALVRRNANRHQWDSIEFERSMNGTAVTIWVTLGLESEKFTNATSGLVSTMANGGTLTPDGGVGGYIYRAPDGTEVTFADPTQHQMGGETNLCNFTQAQATCRLIPTSIVSPDRKAVDLTWDVAPRCKNEFNPNQTLDCEYFWRLERVGNSFGQQIAFSYASDDGSGHYGQSPPASWRQRTRSDFINSAVASTAQASVNYA